MMNNTPTGAENHHESTKLESDQTARFVN